MIVVNVEVDRIEIHARGVTAEPFGYGRTLIERVAGGLAFRAGLKRDARR